MTELENIYLEYRGRVFGYLFGKLKNSAAAEDLCGDVFLKITANIGRFDERKASLSTWIYNITRNTLYDYFRTSRELCELDESLCAEDDFVEEICTGDMLERLADALETLPPREREILILRYYSGQTLTQVASKMGISKSYVLVLQNAALAKLKMYFDV